jgi:hypothetical protein
MRAKGSYQFRAGRSGQIIATATCTVPSGEKDELERGSYSLSFTEFDDLGSNLSCGSGWEK